jgi:hypothetical protein
MPPFSPGIGHVVDDGVEQLLHALVLERGAAQHRHDLARHRARRMHFFRVSMSNSPVST